MAKTTSTHDKNGKLINGSTHIITRNTTSRSYPSTSHYDRNGRFTPKPTGIPTEAQINEFLASFGIKK